MPKRKLLSSLTHNELVKLKVEALVLERMLGVGYVVQVGLCLDEKGYEDTYFFQILKHDESVEAMKVVEFVYGVTYDELNFQLGLRMVRE